FRLAQDRKDLGFAKSARLHQNLLDHIAEKILLLNPVNAREDYRSAGMACRCSRPHCRHAVSGKLRPFSRRSSTA
ncbi:hypothetical protein EHS39_37560, partial [Ensifer sp. MPMI2T]